MANYAGDAHVSVLKNQPKALPPHVIPNVAMMPKALPPAQDHRAHYVSEAQSRLTKPRLLLPERTATSVAEVQAKTPHAPVDMAAKPPNTSWLSRFMTRLNPFQSTPKEGMQPVPETIVKSRRERAAEKLTAALDTSGANKSAAIKLPQTTQTAAEALAKGQENTSFMPVAANTAADAPKAPKGFKLSRNGKIAVAVAGVGIIGGLAVHANSRASREPDAATTTRWQQKVTQPAAEATQEFRR
jgi:hypothetical protein